MAVGRLIDCEWAGGEWLDKGFTNCPLTEVAEVDDVYRSLEKNYKMYSGVDDL